jgi:hypothetical protein
MNKAYRYSIAGSARDGQTWKTEGSVFCDGADVFHVVMHDSFNQLTRGKAVYGKPRMGCQGPYDIDRVLIEQVKQ